LFSRKKTDEQTELDKTIADLEAQMRTYDPDSEAYGTLVNRLERLVKLQERNASKRISPDTLLIVGGNILGIVIIVAHERANVITSKALSFAGKLR
jgi:hypothetical protein